MERDNNSGRPKRPRISKSGGSGNTNNDRKNFKKSENSFDRNSGSDDRRKSNAFDRNSENGDRRKSSSFERGSGNADRKPRTFDSRDKYEKGDLKYGKKPFKKFDDKENKFGKKPYKKYDDQNEDRAKNFVQKRRLEKIEKDIHKDTIRLNKYIANSGICSRREADDLIKQSLVTVNGKVVTEMGYQVQKTDKVVFDGQSITPEKPVYVLLNKPKGYISTTKDEKARKTVMDLVANASPYRVFPVGRLDRSTTGVILLTNDGHLTKKLTHPSFDIKKIYHVTLDKKLSGDDMQAILDGIRLEEGVAKVDSISWIEGKPKNEVGIEIHIGWNRVIRRIFQRLGYEVETLDRVMFAGLTKKNIKRGHWRILTELEVNNLKML